MKCSKSTLIIAALCLAWATRASASNSNSESCTSKKRGLAAVVHWVSDIVTAPAQKYILAAHEKGLINEFEMEVIHDHPYIAAFIPVAICQSLFLSYNICGIGPNHPNITEVSQDEEADAIRHFLFAAFMARAIGREKARLFTTAHERIPANSTRESWASLPPRIQMDLFNNSVALEALESLNLHLLDMTDTRLADEAINALAAGKLKTLTEGTTRCQYPSDLKGRGDEFVRDYLRNWKQYPYYQQVKSYCDQDLIK